MRYLHPVAVSEKFIAKGVYRFYQGETLLPKTETWTRHRLAGGGILTRIDREGEFEGLTTLIEVLTDESGQVERLNVREWNKSPQADYQTLRADYVFFADYIQASRRINDLDTEHEEFRLSADTIIDIPIIVFAGLKWKQLAENDSAQVPVLQPVWWEINKPLMILKVYVTSEVYPLNPEHLREKTILYRVASDQFVAINSHNIPVQCQNLEHIINLTEYAHI
jgi:hypothetical protein